MTVTLPTPEINAGSNDWTDVYSNDKALKEAVETLDGKFPIGLAKPRRGGKTVHLVFAKSHCDRTDHLIDQLHDPNDRG